MPRRNMKGRAKNSRRRSRRRSNATVSVPRPGTSFQARDKQWVGFYGEISGIVPGTGNGIWSIAVDPQGSQGFRERFGYAWQSWRMVGWRVSVNIKAKSTSAAQNYPNSMNPVAPYEIANLPGGATLPTATTIEAFSEIPNCKYMSIYPASPHCRKTFSWRATDINFLPFQNFTTPLIPTFSTSGVWGFVDMSDYQEELTVQAMGHIMIEFKDAQIYINPGQKPVEQLDEDMLVLNLKSPKPVSTVRRLQNGKI